MGIMDRTVEATIVFLGYIGIIGLLFRFFKFRGLGFRVQIRV